MTAVIVAFYIEGDAQETTKEIGDLLSSNLAGRLNPDTTWAIMAAVPEGSKLEVSL